MALPSAPTGVAVQQVGNRVEVAWSPVTATPAVDQYEVQAWNQYDSWNQEATPNASTTTVYLHPHRLGTSAQYAVRAHNSDGWGPYNALPNPSIDVSLGNITGRQITATGGASSRTVRWFPPFDLPTSWVPNSYRIQRSATSRTGPWTVVASNVSGTLQTIGSSIEYADTTDLGDGEYWYRVDAYYSGSEYSGYPEVYYGQSQFDVGTSIVVDSSITVPGAPRNVEVSGGNYNRTVTWDAPVSNGGNAISRYEIQRKFDDPVGTWQLVGRQAGSFISFSMQDPLNLFGGSYEYRVRAQNSAGWSAWSSPLAGIDLPDAGATTPDAPYNVLISGSISQRELAWTAPYEDGGSPITGYAIQRRAGTSGDWTTVNADTGSTALSYTDNATISSGTTQYRVAAVNTHGTGEYSNVISGATIILTGSETESLSAPRNFVLNPGFPNGWDERHFNFEHPLEDGGLTQVRTILQRRDNLQGGWVQKDTQSPQFVNVLSDLENLSAGPYQYRITAEYGNDIFSPWSDYITIVIVTDATDLVGHQPSVEPEPASAPQRLTVTGTDSGNMLTWEAPLDTGGTDITGYNVWRWNGEGWEEVIEDTGNASVTYTDTLQLDPGIVYWYIVRALNFAGEGEWSGTAIALASTARVPTAPLRVSTDAQSTGVVIIWDEPDSSGGSDITGYNIWRWDGIDWNEVTTTAATARTYTDMEPLESGKWFWYTVRATNANGDGIWSETSPVLINPEFPSQPRRLLVDAQSTGVVMNWIAPVDRGASPVTGYNIWRWHASTDWVEVTTTDVVLTYTDTATLTVGDWYWYEVRAVNSNGSGEWSETSAVIINPSLPSAPRRFTADAQSTGVVMSWLAPVDDGTGGAVTGYNIWRQHNNVRTEIVSDTGTTGTDYTDTAALVDGDIYT